MNIYTSQYRYEGPDRMDITVKTATAPGNVLAPTWDMVKGFKSGKLTDWFYTMEYFALIVKRMHSMGEEPRLSLDQIITNYQDITLVCFCPSETFCHRVLAARMLANMGCGTYHGEKLVV